MFGFWTVVILFLGLWLTHALNNSGKSNSDSDDEHH
jgi:hypothetical protein